MFWLDAKRAHDAQLIAKVETYLKDEDTSGSRHPHPGAGRGQPLSPRPHIRKEGSTPSPSLAMCCATTSTDLFPDHGAGHVGQDDAVDRSRCWRAAGCSRPGPAVRRPRHRGAVPARRLSALGSAGRVSLALGASLDHLAQTIGNNAVQVLAETLAEANGKILEYNLFARAGKIGELDSVVAAISTWRCIGRRRWPRGTTARHWQPASNRWRTGWRPTRPRLMLS